MPLNLPPPPFAYGSNHETRRNEALKAADLENHKKYTDIEVGVGKRIVMTSPGGTRWALSISDSGTLVVTEL